MVWTTVICLTLLLEAPPEANVSAEQMKSFLQFTVRIYDESNAKATVGTGAIIAIQEQSFLVLTAHHVVDPGTKLRLEWRGAGDSLDQCEKVEVLERHRSSDLALLKVNCGRKPSACVTISREQVRPQGGERVYSVGCDGGTLPNCASEHIKGLALLRRPESRIAFWVTDAPARPGRSGGPLVNSHGELIGICRGGFEKTKGYPAEGLYASTEEIEKFLTKQNLRQLVFDKSKVSQNGQRTISHVATSVVKKTDPADHRIEVSLSGRTAGSKILPQSP